MRSIRAWFLMSLTLGAVTACGPATGPDEDLAPVSSSQVEQEIGTDPSCPSTQMQDMIVWQNACRTPCANTAGGSNPGPFEGHYGLPGTLFKRCCDEEGRCGDWKQIGPVCKACPN
ncbi:hypothetical protein JYJ95_21325 [Corallococcus exiguus]|uniref:hypothetical protein n=1 Tax=Corallococcus exiguus TaxID=83462 RepID=UPI001A90BAC1|nr:hypothetical protein [Corallococcus exiguus]MBN8469053.1 hypothetical protein [Corallococcus exiguus]